MTKTELKSLFLKLNLGFLRNVKFLTVFHRGLRSTQLLTLDYQLIVHVIQTLHILCAPFKFTNKNLRGLWEENLLVFP